MAGAERVVVFDLGNVLIEWDRAFLFEKLIPDPDELAYFLDHVLTLEANRLLDSGTPLPEMAEQVAAAHPEYRELIETFAARWRETIGDVIDENVQILTELHEAGVPVYALTNWGADTFAIVEPELPFLELFDGMVVSGREGVTKPDPRIFDILCRRYGFEPEQALFVDDSAANVASAMTLGFDAVLYESSPRLRSLLVERRLLPA